MMMRQWGGGAHGGHVGVGKGLLEVKGRNGGVGVGWGASGVE